MPGGTQACGHPRKAGFTRHLLTSKHRQLPRSSHKKTRMTCDLSVAGFDLGLRICNLFNAKEIVPKFQSVIRSQSSWRQSRLNLAVWAEEWRRGTGRRNSVSYLPPTPTLLADHVDSTLRPDMAITLHFGARSSEWTFPGHGESHYSLDLGKVPAAS